MTFALRTCVRCRGSAEQDPSWMVILRGNSWLAWTCQAVFTHMLSTGLGSPVAPGEGGCVGLESDRPAILSRRHCLLAV